MTSLDNNLSMQNSLFNSIFGSYILFVNRFQNFEAHFSSKGMLNYDNIMFV